MSTWDMVFAGSLFLGINTTEVTVSNTVLKFRLTCGVAMIRNNNEYLIYLPWHLKEINKQQNKMDCVCS
jgi:hypothetical protein